MIERKAISVSLTPELHAFVRDLTGTGTYGSVSEVVRAGLRLLREREAQIGDCSPPRPQGQAHASQSKKG